MQIVFHFLIPVTNILYYCFYCSCLSGLSQNIDLRFEDIHLIGFSLGAHVAGFAGSELRNISRITGKHKC